MADYEMPEMPGRGAEGEREQQHTPEARDSSSPAVNDASDAGRRKCLRLCIIFILAGILSVISIARLSIPSSTSDRALEIVMMGLMVGLVFCVVELCWRPFTLPQVNQDAETGDGYSTSLPRNSLALNEPPPSYEEIIAQSPTESPSNVQWLSREPETPKRDFSVLYKPAAQEDDGSPPTRHAAIGPGAESSYYVSASELSLAVDCLPTYEEAVARQAAEGATPSGTRADQDDLILFM